MFLNSGSELVGLSESWFADLASHLEQDDVKTVLKADEGAQKTLSGFIPR